MLKQFQEVEQLPDDDKNVVKKLLDAFLTKKHLQALARADGNGGSTMNATVEQTLISKLRTLSPQQVAEVEDFVDFLAGKARKRAALDRLLAIAPALEAAGAAPMTEEAIAAEVKAARAERRTREQAKGPGADRS